MTRASVCTIGDEILIGQITDTNSGMISRALGAIGIRTDRMVSIGDDRQDILDTLESELRAHEIVIVTGGLGPTKDDITKPALAALSRSEGWYVHEGQLAIVHEILRSRGLDVLPANKDQAKVPSGCEVIVNRRGTAPIMVFRFPETRFGHPASLYAMPGVPFETEAALPDVLEDIRDHFPVADILHRTLMTYGMAESALAQKIAPWEDALPEGMHLAYLPNPLTGVRLRLSAYGADERTAAAMEAQIEALKALLGDLIYATQDDTLPSVIGKWMLAHGKTLSCAESCTGGEIAHLLTGIPGSSGWFLGGVVSYAVSVKQDVLGVAPELIQRCGVVSAEVAAAMAEGARKRTGSDYAVATTGYAGPGGGDEKYPEGSVWIGVATPGGTATCLRRYRNDRARNIERFAASALDCLRLALPKD